MTPEQFDEKLKVFLGNYSQEVGEPKAYTRDYDQYVEITNVRIGDVPIDDWHMSFDAAWANWSEQMTRYLANKTRIVWRIKPEIDSEPVYVMTWQDNERDAWLKPLRRWKIYARLFAS